MFFNKYAKSKLENNINIGSLCQRWGHQASRKDGVSHRARKGKEQESVKLGV